MKRENREPILLVLAAGMGSRYGGLKQIDPVGPNGEIIIDYSLYDATQAGFKKVVFVIKEENRADFDRILARAAKHIKIEYAYQQLDDIPEGCVLPEGRVKPWGTGHAVLAAESKIDAPFAVINSDDFYGRESFAEIYKFLKTAGHYEGKEKYAMVGFLLKNTLTENGFVSRGVCEVENGHLKGIVERTRIEKRDGGIAFSEDDGQSWQSMPGETIVSMNHWGFTTSIFESLHRDFKRLFEEAVPRNPLKTELFLPFVVDAMLKEGKIDVKVLSSTDKWYGVTYAEDKKTVKAALKEMMQNGVYPQNL